MNAARRVLALGCLALAAACEHTVPYDVAGQPPNPLRTGTLRQVTFNVEGDWWPGWLPDGSGIGFSYQAPERSDRDRCIAWIPPLGGRIFREVCQKGEYEWESLNVASAHGVSPGGRVAVVVESGRPRALAPAYKSLYVGRLGNDTLHRVLGFPYTAPNGRLHVSAAYFAWPNESTLVFLALLVNYRPPVQQIPGDTVITGIEIVQLDLSGDSIAAMRVIPGTLGASSVAPAADGAVYITMGGDSRVFVLDLATGLTTPVFDFDTLGIARDVQVAGERLVAVVGGHVQYTPLNPTFGIPQQADSGGMIASVALPNGAVQLLSPLPNTRPRPGEHSYLHLALSPSGRALAAESYTYFERHLFANPDTVINKATNLWLIDVP